MLIAGELTEQIIGLGIEVHRNTGRGLLESAMSNACVMNCGRPVSRANARCWCR